MASSSIIKLVRALRHEQPESEERCDYINEVYFSFSSVKGIPDVLIIASGSLLVAPNAKALSQLMPLPQLS